LRQTDPLLDKERIKESKDPLLENSCDWVFTDEAFQTWWHTSTSYLLWISGDPGKGKTMIAIASIEHVQEELKRQETEALVAFFFFQSTDPALNTAVSALRALIFVLIDQRKSLIRHIRARYNSAGNGLFEGQNAFFALWAVLEDILRDPELPPAFLFIDALDECNSQQTELLKYVIRFSSTARGKVKWLLTSRNESWIKEHLAYEGNCLDTSLELNAHNVSHAVCLYINAKVQDLAQQKRYSAELVDDVRAQLELKAEGTFLWVALVCKELAKLRGVRHVRRVLEGFPPGLQAMYERMMSQIEQVDNAEDVDYCRRILAFVTLACRPLSIPEINHMAGFPGYHRVATETMTELLDLCAPFLVVHRGMVYFIHQSAKDFFKRGDGLRIFASTIKDEHHHIAIRALELMSRTLKKDICGMVRPGIMLAEVKNRIEQFLSGYLLYPCTYWMYHLCQSSRTRETIFTEEDIERVTTFFQTHLLHWLEVLAIIGEISEGIQVVRKIEEVIHVRFLRGQKHC
jgi:hypothetical protein